MCELLGWATATDDGKLELPDETAAEPAVVAVLGFPVEQHWLAENGTHLLSLLLHEIGPRLEIRVFGLDEERVEHVHDLAHQIAHFVLVEARHLRPGNAPAGGIDHDNVRVVPRPGDRGEVLVQGFEHRLPDAHQRQNSDKSRNLPAFLRIHDGVRLPLSRIVSTGAQ